jgi:ankyrin repeat protein
LVAVTVAVAALLGFAIFAVFSTPSLAADEALFQRVQNDDLPGVEAAIAEGQDVNARDGMGRTPLFFVSENPRIVEVLLAASADVNAADGEGYTPLHLAASWPKKLWIAEMLIDAGANVNAQTQYGMTPLIIASFAANLAPDGNVHRLVEMLLRAGANVNAKSEDGTSALHWWSGQGKPGIIRLLLDAGADVNPPDSTLSPLMWAVTAPNNVRSIEMLIEGGADVNAKAGIVEGMTVLSLAALLGKAEDVSVFLKAGAKLESMPGGLTPLHLAAGIIAMEREGVSGSFEERAKQATSSIVLSGQEFRPDFLGAAKLLVEACADLDAKSDKLLSGKSLRNVFTFWTGLRLEDVDYSQFEDKTPLEFARIVGSEEVAKYLSEI